jgi:geranylgeranyl pyrophosphate synthase
VAEDLDYIELRLRASIADDDRPPMSGPMGALFAAGGKRLRPALVLLAGRMGEFRAAHHHAAMAVELVHAATLVHDDVIDKSPLRRGLPTVAAALGDEPAIVVGDYYFAKASEQAAQTGEPAVVAVIAGAVMEICRGELAQHESRYRYQPSIEEYLLRSRAKTATLLAVSAWTGGRLAGLDKLAQAALHAYGTELGLAFQIADDVLDYTADAGELGKPVGQDLLEGHATLPLLLAGLREPLPEGEPLSRERVAQVVAEVNASGGPERALEEARRYAESARGHLAALPAGPPRESLQNLASYVVERRR